METMSITKTECNYTANRYLRRIVALESWLERLMGYGAALGLILLCGVVMLQVFARLFLDTPPVWTEELSRYLFIGTVALATGVAYKRGELVAVELLYNALNKRHALIFNILISATIVAFCLIITPAAVQFAQIGEYQLSPTLFFPMSYVFYSMVLICLNLALFALFKLVKSAIMLFCPEDI